MRKLNLDLKKFVIDRTKWRSGMSGIHSTGTGKTRLLNTRGFMCCLGQICEQMGVDKLHDVSSPKYLPVKIPILQNWFIDGEVPICEDSNLAQEAMDINDSEVLTREERESQLIELFQSAGIELEFINEIIDNE